MTSASTTSGSFGSSIEVAVASLKKKMRCWFQKMGIPKRIFMYWDGPAAVLPQSCIERIRRLHPSWRVTVLRRPEEKCVNLDALSTQHKSDWARICAIARHGGIWLDATCVCTRPVTEWVDLSSTRVQGFSCPFHEDVLENWAFGACRRHPLVLEWKKEFQHAIAIGFDAYKNTFVTRYPEHERLIDYLPYLTMHACYVVASDRINTYARMTPSCDTAFQYLEHAGWDSSRAVQFLLDDLMEDIPSLLKLRGAERMILQPLLGSAKEGSFVHKYITTQVEPSAPVNPSIIARMITCVALLFAMVVYVRKIRK